jgi:hypothetical protein
MLTSHHQAPGAPGIEPHWTSSAKTGVGTALSNKSRVWFTLSHGIFNEIYYPRIDQACVRDKYLKLRRSLLEGRVFDLPPQTVKRYLTEKTVSPRIVWRFNHKIRSMPPGKLLRIETLAPAVIHWSADDWSTAQDARSHDAGLGIHLADLSTKALPEGKQVKFTFYWPEAGQWEGKNFIVHVGSWPQDGSAAEKRVPDEK